FFDEILSAPTTEELLAGVYSKALPALESALTDYRADTNSLCDAPSVRVCRFARLEVDDMRRFGEKCLTALADAQMRESMREWLALLDSCLQVAGGLDGTLASSDHVPARRHSAKPYTYDPMPQRDERWQDLWNQGVNPEAFLYDPAFEAQPKT